MQAITPVLPYPQVESFLPYLCCAHMSDCRISCACKIKRSLVGFDFIVWECKSRQAAENCTLMGATVLQTAYFCNLTGDPRMPPHGAYFPLTVRVPVGVTSTVVFANITGTIPGTNPPGYIATNGLGISFVSANPGKQSSPVQESHSFPLILPSQACHS